MTHSSYALVQRMRVYTQAKGEVRFGLDQNLEIQTDGYMMPLAQTHPAIVWCVMSEKCLKLIVFAKIDFIVFWLP